MKSEVDGAEVGIGRGTNLIIGRQAQYQVIAGCGLLQITVLLSIDSEIKLADGISGLEGRGGAEVGDRVVVPALLDQGMGKVIFRDVIALGDGQSVRPKAEIVVPVTQLNAGDGRKSKQDGESSGGQVF